MVLAVAPVAPALADARLGADEVNMLAHEHAVNQREIAAGKLAMKLGATKAVRDFGKQLVDDHTQADARISTLAGQKTVTIGDDVPLSEIEKQRTQDLQNDMVQLETITGRDFDQKFLQMMVDGHTREAARVNMYMAQATDGDLKSTLTELKPVMQKHADTAADLLRAETQQK